MAIGQGCNGYAPPYQWRNRVSRLQLQVESAAQAD